MYDHTLIHKFEGFARLVHNLVSFSKLHFGVIVRRVCINDCLGDIRLLQYNSNGRQPTLFVDLGSIVQITLHPSTRGHLEEDIQVARLRVHSVIQVSRSRASHSPLGEHQVSRRLAVHHHTPPVENKHRRSPQIVQHNRAHPVRELGWHASIAPDKSATSPDRT